MRQTQLDRLLTSAAVALALGVLSAQGSLAQGKSEADTATTSATTASAITSEPAKDAPAAAPATDDTPKPAAATPEPTPTPAKPATTASTADTQVADLLRELASGKFDRLVGGKKDRTSLEAFYSARNYAPLWIANGTASDRAKAAIAYLARVDADGLDPADYPLPALKDGLEPQAQAEAELRFTQTVLTYARHALHGRVHYSRVGADIDFELAKFDPADVLGKLADSKDVAATLDGFQPQAPGYKALRAKLAEARGIKPGSEVKRIPGGQTLRLVKDRKGKVTVMDDARVPLLRERLAVEGDKTSVAYDQPVVDAVTEFQKSHGLPANGQLTAATIEAINGPSRDRDADIITVNLERWRWLPRNLGKTHVMVNVPDFSLRLVRDDKLYWGTKIVAGKPSQATPMTSAEMKFITVNPTWNVPPSIIKNEYLPALQQDPNALARIGLKVEQNRDGTVRIYQPPGDRNALGRIRFNFPNKFLVYQHDTPDKHLFAHAKRAYSHGCMRVENPLMYGEKILSLALPNEHYTAERLRKMFGGSEVNINFPSFIPVHLTYQTAFVDDDGKLQIREDVYGRDAKMLALLKGTERRVADTAIDRPKPSFSAPVRMPPGTVGTGYNSGPSFFDVLFGGPRGEAQPPRPSRRVSRNQ